MHLNHLSMKISVCLTHYNRPAGLEKSLESILQQNRMPDEVLVGDDASTESPESVVAKFYHRVPGLRLVRNPQNLGMPGNLISTISQTKGEYVVNLHDGDAFSPCLISRWERCLDQDSRIGMAFCSYDCRPNGGKLWRHGDISESTPGDEFFDLHVLPESSSKIWGTVIARRSAYKTVGNFDPQYGPWADVDMWVRISRSYHVGYARDATIYLSDDAPHFRRFTWKPPVYLLCMKEARLRQSDSGKSPRTRIDIARGVFRKSVSRQIFGCARRGLVKHAILGISLLKLSWQISDAREIKRFLDARLASQQETPKINNSKKKANTIKSNQR